MRPAGFVVSLAALVVPACSLDSIEAVSSTDQAVIGGAPSAGDQPTVMLASYPADKHVLSTCTAVFVTPTVMLTAAHCIDPATMPGYTFGYFPGDDANQYDTLLKLEPHLLPIASVHVHPNYDGNLVGDIGVVVLAAPGAVAPATFNRTALGPSVVGKSARIVGYGQTIAGTNNQKRYEATTTVKSLDDQVIEIGDVDRHTCVGDSGGPVFVDGVVVGIDSYGPQGCTGPSHFQRTDAFLPFIEQYAPPPATGGDAGPDGGDTMPPASDDGGCATAGGSRGSLAGVIAALGLAISRRRRR